jgi:hypothetical protein
VTPELQAHRVFKVSKEIQVLLERLVLRVLLAPKAHKV